MTRIVRSKKKLLREFLGNYLNKIQRGYKLTRKEALKCFRLILEEDSRSSDFYWGALFAAIQTRGPDLNETLGFIDALMEFESIAFSKERIKIPTEKPVIAMVGSGKEDFKTFNISTGASLVASAAGIVVIKPCSKAISAVTGATDVLNTIGANIFLSFERIAECCAETDFCSFDYSHYVQRYASRYNGLFYHFHPLSYITPALCIPFSLDGIVLGISDINVLHGASLLKRFGFNNAFVIAGTVKNTSMVMDELSILGPSYLGVVNGLNINQKVFDFKSVGILEGKPSDIAQKGSHLENAITLLEAITGKGSNGPTDIVCLNAALLIRLAGRVKSLDEGVNIARILVKKGKVLSHLKNYIRKIGGDISIIESLINKTLKH